MPPAPLASPASLSAAAAAAALVILAVLLFSLATAPLPAAPAAAAPLSPSLVSLVTFTKLPNTVCAGFCLPRANEVESAIRNFDCDEKPPLNRLRVGMQVDNCPPALQSASNANEVEQKIEKLADNDVFIFFRGTAALFLVDLMCTDPLFVLKKKTMPRVLSNGDSHPLNFGTQVLDNGGLVWGVNDFDQSFYSPFSWDLKRGATGTALACIAQGWNEAVCHAAIDAFVLAYMRLANSSNVPLTGQDRFLEGSRASLAAPEINQLFIRARKAESDAEVLKWLQHDLSVDVDRDQFMPSPKVTPLPDSVVPKFQAAIDAYLYNGVAALMLYPPGDFWKVLAVASVNGSGTGSIGLNRFHVLLRGKKSTYGGRIVLEMKQEIHSTIEIMFKYKYSEDDQGKRAVDAERGAYPYANPFYGWTNYNGHAYIIREKSKHEKTIELGKLSAQEFMDYSTHSGRALAMYHFQVRCPDHFCRLDDAVAVNKELWKEVAAWINSYPQNGMVGFTSYVSSWAKAEADRQITEWTQLRSFVREARARRNSPLELLDSHSDVKSNCNS